MKRIYLHTFAAMAAALTIAGCAEDDTDPDAVSDCPTFSASIDGAHTRAIDDYWENGDKIGISGGGAVNICHVNPTGDQLFTPENPEEQFYFQNSDPVEFTAYYPYNSSRDAATGLIGISTADQANQGGFDFLWASGIGSKSSPTVKFNFTHRMSKVSFVFKNGNDMAVTNINRIRLTGIVAEGTFDTTTGTCEISAGQPATSTTMALAKVIEDEPVKPLFLFPQKVAGAVKLEIYDCYSQYFVCDLTVPDDELLAGTYYEYAITVSKTGLTVSGATLADWIEETGKSEASSTDE